MVPPRQAFTRTEAYNLWARLVAGWTNHLNNEGSATLLDGYHYLYDENGSQEGVTRMMWGLGGWLSRPERSPIVTWRGVDYDVAALTRRAFLSGTDPDSPGYWGESPFPGSPDIWMVDAGQVAFALWQSRSFIWDHFTPIEREQVISWLERCGHHPGEFRNNFALFWMLNHASRKALGERHDDQLIEDVLDYMDNVYCGDGWYDDAAARGANYFDDYNFWVFGSHAMAWSQVDGDTRPGRKQILVDRLRQLMEHYPSFFAANGAYTEFGRSLAYKFARLGAPLWAYQQGAWPHDVGMLRRLVGNHLRWYAEHGAIRGDDTLRQELTSEGSADIRETYISTGSAYWATQGFGALWSIPDDDPFWTTEESPLPVERGDFVRVMPEPGWVLVGNQATGAVQRFNAKAGKIAAKYGKYHYATAAPFNAGLVDGRPSPDGMLCLQVGDDLGHRDLTLASAVGEPGWLRFRYTETVGGQEHLIETAIAVRKNQHLRVHRIELASDDMAVAAVEGAAPLGYAPGEVIRTGVNDQQMRSWSTVRERYYARHVAIEALQGYTGVSLPTTWRGASDLNSVYGRYVLPRLQIDRVESGKVYACLVTIGDETDQEREDSPSPIVAWQDDDTIIVSWPGEDPVTIPSLGEDGPGRANREH